MIVDILTDVIINKPVEEVFGFILDTSKTSLWCKNVISVEKLVFNQRMVGNRTLVKADYVGRQVTLTFEIVEFIQNQKAVLKSVDDEYPLETIFIWTPIGGNKTNVMLRNIGQPIHFPKEMAPLMNRMMRKVQVKDLKKLKNILENS